MDVLSSVIRRWHVEFKKAISVAMSSDIRQEGVGNAMMMLSDIRQEGIIFSTWLGIFLK